MAQKKNLLYLLENPTEPAYIPKGDNKVVFDIPTDYIADCYKYVGVQLFNRFGEEATERIPVKEISLPKLEDIMKLPRQANFSLFIPFHRKISGQLIDIFMGMKTLEDLQSMAVYARDRVNPYLFNYCLSVVLLHRKDTQDLDVPSVIESFPDKFFDSQILNKVREHANIVPIGSRTPIEVPIDFTASNEEVEHRMAYWREDIGFNLHHYHWHLVYPFNGPRELVNKNRRGELFYYMHQQIIARYNFERLSYFPKLGSSIAGRPYLPRVANQSIKDLNREQDQIKADVALMEQWRDRIFAAIHSGMVEDEAGKSIRLTELEGTDVLGNLIESSSKSPNKSFYGDLHNFGHVFLAYVHDPDNRHLESFGVLGDHTTAARDPVFYTWHAYIDDIFRQFKETLPSYPSQGASENVLSTFWQQSDLNLTRGMDFQPRGPVFIRFTHLQHQPFTYYITVNNTGCVRQGTCRIFIAPATDEEGKPWLFRHQRTMFVELDKFVVNLQPGQNTIVRRSDQSSLTIPFERTFRNLETNRPGEGTDAVEQFNFCGCGWPHHLLIPKGTPEGKASHLFVMISDYKYDRVEQDTNVPCTEGSSYCGIKDKLYPDRRCMGYPFDRAPRKGVSTLQQFLTPNMIVKPVIIRFTNRTIRKQQN
ncbi:hypothetical protein RI129_013127 [Pyrocoelia pectoralis]|uniref:Tyrosinase copper-binding domain-containing protein n=1 Tax=Pyrocoelia pectoralis TaxID=417401 RepID=A0AAN7UZU2_9COLE